MHPTILALYYPSTPPHISLPDPIQLMLTLAEARNRQTVFMGSYLNVVAASIQVALVVQHKLLTPALAVVVILTCLAALVQRGVLYHCVGLRVFDLQAHSYLV